MILLQASTISGKLSPQNKSTSRTGHEALSDWRAHSDNTETTSSSSPAMTKWVLPQMTLFTSLAEATSFLQDQGTAKVSEKMIGGYKSLNFGAEDPESQASFLRW